MEGMQPAPGGAVEPEARTFGMLTHLAAFAGWIFPFGNILGPLIVWLVKKDQYPFVDEHGKESLNFQITLGIGHIILVIIAVVSCGIAAIVTVPLNLLLLLGGTIYCVIGGIAANNGQPFQYPMTWRVIR